MREAAYLDICVCPEVLFAHLFEASTILGFLHTSNMKGVVIIAGSVSLE